MTVGKLVSTRDMLTSARGVGAYVPAFNIYNLETIQAALDSSSRVGQPVILAFGERYLPHASLHTIAVLARCLSAEHLERVALHLDHCVSLEHIRAALDAGFTSVMYDGSALPISQNIRETLMARRIADEYGASLEGELGGLNDELGGESKCCMTDPVDAARFAQETNVDMLAVSVGNAHGLYTDKPHIDLPLLEQISHNVAVPLVLHGGSGIPRSTLLAAVRLGIAKINVNTEIALAGADAASEALRREKRFDPVMLDVRHSMARVMERWYCDTLDERCI